MDLRCPKCNSTDLKKVSLAYQEGLYGSHAHTRLSAALVGGNGPDLVVGRATTHTSHQSALSKRLSPPAKWSYLKVGSWSILVFLCVGWLVFYINTVTTNSSTVSSPPLTLFALISGAIFALLLFFAWRHNHSIYQKQYAQWDKSFICERCGTVLQ
jgi:hypothetical protein